MDDALAEIGRIRHRLAELDGLVTRKPSMNELIRAAASPEAPTEPGPEDTRHAAIINAAKARGFHNPELVARLLAGETGDPGVPLDQLAAEEPYLLTPSMNELIRGAAGQGE